MEFISDSLNPKVIYILLVTRYQLSESFSCTSPSIIVDKDEGVDTWLGGERYTKNPFSHQRHGRGVGIMEAKIPKSKDGSN